MTISVFGPRLFLTLTGYTRHGRQPVHTSAWMDFTGKSFGYRLHIFSRGKQLNNSRSHDLSLSVSSVKVKILYKTVKIDLKGLFNLDGGVS